MNYRKKDRLAEALMKGLLKPVEKQVQPHRDYDDFKLAATPIQESTVNREALVSSTVAALTPKLAGWQKKLIAENKEDDKEKVHFTGPLKDGHAFEVVKRNTKGMSGSQDAYMMRIKKKDGGYHRLGSHPSDKGAEKWYHAHKHEDLLKKYDYMAESNDKIIDVTKNFDPTKDVEKPAFLNENIGTVATSLTRQKSFNLKEDAELTVEDILAEHRLINKMKKNEVIKNIGAELKKKSHLHDNPVKLGRKSLTAKSPMIFAKEEIVEAKKESENKKLWKSIMNKGVVPSIDRDKYPNRDHQGLEGPFRHHKSGNTYYYDKKEGKYYHPDSDMYHDHITSMTESLNENPHDKAAQSEMIAETEKLGMRAAKRQMSKSINPFKKTSEHFHAWNRGHDSYTKGN